MKTTIPTPALIAALTPYKEFSKIIHSSIFTPKLFAVNIIYYDFNLNISGLGFPLFILLSSPVIIISKSESIHFLWNDNL